MAYVISANSIELLDFWRKGGSFIDNKLNKFVRGGFTRQEAELFIARSSPSSNDGKRNLNLVVSAINVKATSMLTITPPIGSMTVHKRLRVMVDVKIDEDEDVHHLIRLPPALITIPER